MMAGICSMCGMAEHTGINCDREELKRMVLLLKEGLRLKTMELEATKKIDAKGVIMITSLISHRSEKPRIDIQVGEIHTQMSADAAMNVAKQIIECSQGAYADAFIFHFLREKLDQPRAVAGQIIEEFREYRDGLAAEFMKEQAGFSEDGK